MKLIPGRSQDMFRGDVLRGGHAWVTVKQGFQNALRALSYSLVKSKGRYASTTMSNAMTCVIAQVAAYVTASA